MTSLAIATMICAGVLLLLEWRAHRRHRTEILEITALVEERRRKTASLLNRLRADEPEDEIAATTDESGAQSQLSFEYLRYLVVDEPKGLVAHGSQWPDEGIETWLELPPIRLAHLLSALDEVHSGHMMKVHLCSEREVEEQDPWTGTGPIRLPAFARAVHGRSTPWQ